MAKGFLFLLLALMAINLVHMLPRKEFVVENTPENTERLNNLGPDDLAEMFSGQFEGDMVMSPQEIAELTDGKGGKTVLIDTTYKWRNNIVPYKIEDGYFTVAQINYITLGAQKLMDTTCLKFVPYDPTIHADYIFITGENSGCWSYVGKRGGGQQLNLQVNDFEVGCFRLYTIVHEFLHALGVYHMQSATERDEYVEIVWDNIQEGTQNNFQKYDAAVISQYGVEYDYGSVMHYPRTAFSINGQDTIIALKDLGGEVMGQRVRLSEKDIARLNAKYCPKIDNRPKSLAELFALIHKRVQKAIQNIKPKNEE